jgi:hypothetical protein
MITAVLGCTVLACGCRKPEEESPQARQARAIADRKKALEYLKEDGEVDWRKRVDAASEALAEAKSDRRWGRNEQALEHALAAAQLMPPQSKDFDSPMPSSSPASAANSTVAADSADSDAGAEEDEKGSDGDMPADGGAAEDELLAGDGDSVSNDEVQQLRESLEALLESLDGKTGRVRSDLSFERDAIEIR